MKLINKFFSLFVLLVILNIYGQKTQNVWKDYIDFKKVTPKEYFAKLKIDSSKFDSQKNYLITIPMTTPKSWMTKKDVEYLMNYIDSEEPAYCVMQIISSHLPLNEKSTLGGQAMNLIDSYRLKENYPYVLTDCSKTDKKRITEIRKWWNEEN
ncbi:hypothetical protein D3C87_373020 [compost metagenome]